MKQHKSMLETAVAIMKRKRSPQHFTKIYDEVSTELEFSEEVKTENLSKFYSDLSLSALFIYTGDNNWDLKERQPVDMWDKDASFFIDPEELKARKAERQAERAALRKEQEELEELKDLDLESEDMDSEDEFEDLLIDEEDEAEGLDFSEDDDEAEDDLDEETEEVEEVDEEELDEEDYNEIMDEYEDMYEDDK